MKEYKLIHEEIKSANIIELDPLLNSLSKSENRKGIKLIVEAVFNDDKCFWNIKRYEMSRELSEKLGVFPKPKTKNIRPKQPTLRDLILSMKDEISLIKNDINEMKGDIKTLKKDVNILKDDVSILKDDVKVLKQDMNTIKSLPTISKELKKSHHWENGN